MATPVDISNGSGLDYPAVVPNVPVPHAPHRRITDGKLSAPPVGDEAVGSSTETVKEPSVWANGLDWPVLIWIAIVHVGAVAGLFFFSWQALAVTAFLCWATGSIGVCMGYHRYLTHGSFQTYKPVRYFLAFMGGMSGEGSALTWVANHRKHHAHSDKEGDPHSPRDGGFWSHMLWFIPNFGRKWHDDLTSRWAPDLEKDRGMLFLHKTFLVQHVIAGLALFAVGYYGWGGSMYMALSMLTWGMFMRMVYVLHVTWFVNSATHIWGYRNYETSDDSRNLWWVGLLAFGEGWHNNHHAFQRMAKHGHRWWEVDATYMAICAMEKVGLAWNVVHKVPKHAKPA